MLSKNKMVRKARKALETLYDGTCSVTERRKIKKANGSTGFEETETLKDVPCRLSYQNIDSTSQSENGAAAVTQVIKLFIAPNISISPGAKITVTQNGVATEYAHSGKAAVYDTHNEIILDLFRGWA